MKAVLLCLFAGFLLGSCANVEENQATDSKEQETETPKETKSETSEEAVEYPFPVYTTYEEIAPLFNRQTDTTYVINFWATWCKPCVEELPYFEQLVDEYKDEKVKVILVSLDFPKDLQKKLVPFLEERQLKSDIAVLLDGDYNSWIDNVSTEWGGAIPVTLIYNSQERNFIGEQFHDYEDLNTALKTVFKS